MKKKILFAVLLLSGFSIQAQWFITGNSNINPAINYLGTTNDVDLVFKRWNVQSGLLNQNLTAFGVGALNPSSTGLYNTAIGSAVLTSNTTGIFNTGTGFNSLIFNTTGSFNTATGASSLFKITTGSGNVASGFNSLFNTTTGNNNTATGHEVLSQNITGNYNTAYGAGAGGDLTSGTSNTFIGTNTGRGIVSGSANTIIGNNVTGLPATLANNIIIADGDGNQRILVDNTGKVRIGETTLTMPGSYKLYVETGILTERLKVAIKTTSDWSDYVFDEHYKLKPLGEVKTYIAANKHLPGVPSAEEMVKQGMDVAEANAKLLEKIEELTLYIIQMNERMEKLEKENTAAKKRVNRAGK